MNLKVLPPKPGVYFFKDKDGRIIYVGKALSLKSRVKSYFRQKNLDPKTRLLVSRIKSVDFQIVNSEFEALILEAQMIKQHKPKYNIRLKDNKRYLYIAVYADPLPRLDIVRRPELEKNLIDWFGPFPCANDARAVLKFIRRIFPYNTYKKHPVGPCFYCHLSLCPGLPVLQSKGHLKTIRQIRNFLSGKTGSLVSKLKKEMTAAAKNLDFEKAASIKRKIDSLTNVTQAWRSVPKDDLPESVALISLIKILVRRQQVEFAKINKIEAYDISNLGKSVIVGAMVAFVNGQPEPKLYRKFNIAGYNGPVAGIEGQQNDPLAIYQIVKRRLTHREWGLPQLILVDGGKTQTGAAYRALLETKLTGQIGLVGLEKRFETIIIPRTAGGKIRSWKSYRLPRRSPLLQLFQHLRDEAHRFGQKYYRQLYRKNIISP